MRKESIQYRKPLKPIKITGLGKGEVILRLDTYREESPRRFKWQFWLPKYGKQHLYALTEKGIYDVTQIVEESKTFKEKRNNE